MMNANNHMDEERVIIELKCSDDVTLRSGIWIVFTALQMSVSVTNVSFLINLYEIIIVLWYNI